MTDVSDAEWLAELFRFEYCAACGGDAEHHTAVPFLGNPFARCDYPPDADGSYHPTIIAFRNAEHDDEPPLSESELRAMHGDR